MKSQKFNNIIMLFVAILFCIPSILFAEAEEKIEKIYPLDSNGKVYLENNSGDIVIKSWGKNEVKILAHKIARNKKSLDKATIDINQTNGMIRIITRHHKSFDLFQSKDVSVYYDLFIPDKAKIRVKSLSGRVEAWEIGGFLDIETASGRIDIVRAKNGVKCKTINGDIYLEEITGDIVLKSTSGKITTEGVNGSVEANTVSGDLDINEVSSAEEINMESIKGNMEIQGELTPGGIYEFNTISGRIRLILPFTSDFELRTNTINGDIQCDFELDILDEITRNKIQGVAGKGSSSLKISSFSGDIIINKGK